MESWNVNHFFLGILRTLFKKHISWIHWMEQNMNWGSWVTDPCNISKLFLSFQVILQPSWNSTSFNVNSEMILFLLPGWLPLTNQLAPRPSALGATYIQNTFLTIQIRGVCCVPLEYAGLSLSSQLSSASLYFTLVKPYLLVTLNL